MKLGTIYGLCSSRDGRIRYVGQTVQGLPQRRYGHISQAIHRPHYPVCRWINKELDRGFDIVIFPIEEQAVLNEAEMRLIAWYKSNGARLVNATDGGDGVRGLKNPAFAQMNKSADHRAKVSAANRQRAGRPGVPHSKETKRKLSAIKRGTKMSEATRQKMSIARRGKQRVPLSPEWRAKISATLKGRVIPHLIEANEKRRGIPLTAEQRTKVSTALRGRVLTRAHRANISTALRKYHAKLYS